MERQERRNRSADEARELVAQARARGLTQREFAKELGVHPNTVYGWFRKERDANSMARAGEPVSLVPVRVVAPRGLAATGQESSERRIEVLVDRFVLRLPPSVDASDLRTVLAVLEEARC